MLKKTILAIGLLLTACGTSTPPVKPTTPVAITTPAPIAIPEPAPPPPALTLSATTKHYTNAKHEWSIDLPDNMTVADQDEDSVKVVAADQTTMMFVRATTTEDVETTAQEVAGMFAKMGHSNPRVGHLTVASFKAVVLIYGNPNYGSVVAFTVFNSGHMSYALAYGGSNNQERVDVYKAALQSITLKEPAVQAAKPTKKTH